MHFEDTVASVINETKAVTPDAESAASVCATALAYFAAEAGLDHAKVLDRLRHDLETMCSAMQSNS